MNSLNKSELIWATGLMVVFIVSMTMIFKTNEQTNNFTIEMSKLGMCKIAGQRHATWEKCATSVTTKGEQ